MGQPLFLVDNLFNGGFPGSQYPNNTITAEEEGTNHEVFHLANGRRSPLDFWTSTTANSDTWAETRCNRVRAADMVVIDAGHNLAGETVQIEGSDDNFTTIDTIHSAIIPSVSSPGNIDNALGIVTEEGVWMRRVPLRAHRYYRVFIPAMGADLRPQIIGLWIGLSWEPGLFWNPLAANRVSISGPETITPQRWRGRALLGTERVVSMTVKLPSLFAYDQARLHIEGLFAANEPMWVIPDQDQADQAFLAVPPLGRIGFNFGDSSDWGYLQMVIEAIEHEPLRT